MKLGIYLRNMGPQSTRSLIADAARAAEEAGIDDLWVADHLALPPEESEGSDGHGHVVRRDRERYHSADPWRRGRLVG
jgi:alkanesulfonate monooxygenase SsuD/methylene tetrahydromethanopterin reductase-like flavin-dependent oxidoreductase (luciferase family)